MCTQPGSDWNIPWIIIETAAPTCWFQFWSSLATVCLFPGRVNCIVRCHWDYHESSKVMLLQGDAGFMLLNVKCSRVDFANSDSEDWYFYGCADCLIILEYDFKSIWKAWTTFFVWLIFSHNHNNTRIGHMICQWLVYYIFTAEKYQWDYEKLEKGAKIANSWKSSRYYYWAWSRNKNENKINRNIIACNLRIKTWWV
jgi:hypothetical protein